jgi:aryl-alcohol dehydrogenase-like predicted oxidoreductase
MKYLRHFADFPTQTPYSLVERGYETTHRPLIQRSGLGMMPYYALGAGFLTGKYRPGVSVDSARAKGLRPGEPNRISMKRGIRLLGVLDEIAAEHHVTVASVALAWLMAQPTVTAPIASARTVEQLDAILPSTQIHLIDEDLRRLDEASAEN